RRRGGRDAVWRKATRWATAEHCSTVSFETRRPRPLFPAGWPESDSRDGSAALGAAGSPLAHVSPRPRDRRPAAAPDPPLALRVVRSTGPGLYRPTPRPDH